MKTKYTPAPWQAYNAINGRILTRWHIKGNNKSLASVHAQDSSEEEAANALLIAAAPELAEALNDILEQCSRTDAGVWMDADKLKDHLATIARHALQNAGLVS